MAGEIAKPQFGRPIRTKTKADSSPVTPVDIEINDFFYDWSTHYPDLGYIAEEGNGQTYKEYILYVDPLDGTGAYARGMATASIIATIMHVQNDRGTPVTTFIHNPVTEETWYAVKGDGAHKLSDGRRLPLLSPSVGRIKTAVCAWPDASHNLEHVSRQISQAYQEGFSDQQMGAFGIGGGLIAQGTLDTTACGVSSAVETAAMMLLVNEVGGVAIDLNGDPIVDFELGEWKGKTDFLLPNGAIIASDQATAEKLLAFINKHKIEEDFMPVYKGPVLFER
jgi:myo-inositol-1(or 4)-monophosphatase